MPERVEPALALLKEQPPHGSEWSWEIKWDGYRLAVHIEPQGVRIITRGGHDWTHRFPAIVEAAESLGPATMIIDGEVVVLDKQGRADFSLLQKSLGASGKRAGSKASNAILMGFDLLYLDGYDLREMEQRSRKHLLGDLLTEKDGAIRLSENLDEDPDVLLEHACQLGLEGIIGKREDQPYRSGRNGDWVKVKCTNSEAFFIVGYQPSSTMQGGFASLALAAYHGDDLVYVGNVGTGFKTTEAIKLRKTLDTLRWKRKQPPVPDVNEPDLVWVEPTLIAEIEFRAWTDDGKLRHASYKGMRERQDNAEVLRLD